MRLSLPGRSRVDEPEVILPATGPAGRGVRRLGTARDLLPLLVLVACSAAALIVLDVGGIEPGVAAPLWEAPTTWLLVLVFPLIVAGLDAVAARLRYRLAWREALARIRVGRVLQLAAVVAALRLLLLTAVARKKAIPHLHGGFTWDERLSAADAWLHGGVTPDRWLTPLLDSPVLLRAIDILYLEAFWIVCVGVLLWWGWQRDPRRAQFFAAFALVWLLLGAVAATLFASAGPCYYTLVVGEDTYAPLMAALHRAPLSATAIQGILWRNYMGEATGVAEGISAFPSVHVAMPALFAWSARGRWRWAGWTFCALVLLGSVVLGWHYAVDGYAAILGAWLCWRLGGVLAGWTHRTAVRA